MHQDGAQQHYGPGDIKPKQKNRHRGKGSVNQCIAGVRNHGGEHRLGSGKGHGYKKPANEGVTEGHGAVGYGHVEGRDTQYAETKGQRREQGSGHAQQVDVFNRVGSGKQVGLYSDSQTHEHRGEA